MMYPYLTYVTYNAHEAFMFYDPLDLPLLTFLSMQSWILGIYIPSRLEIDKIDNQDNSSYDSDSDNIKT